MSSSSWLRACALTSGLLCTLPALANPAPSQAPPACLAPASWARTDGVTPQRVDADGLLAAMAGRAVVLLGEQHDDMDHHRWQLQTLATLHTLRPRMVIGFEMFPRRVQPVLDRWVGGELTEAEFLQQAEWGKVWSMPAELYLPLFHFARLNRIPMLALNIDAELTRRIADKGWDGVPEGEREGVGRPAAALPAYEDFLFEIHSQHAQMRMHGKDKDKAEPARSDAAFRNFVDSQLAWDRAMAEAMVAGRARHAAADGSLPLVVGIMGNGHVRHGHGVAHQLVALGEPSVGQLMPVEAATPCADLPAGLADAVFAVPALRQQPPPPPRLGVGLEDAEGGIRIAELTAGSLAERTGLRRGDLITEAAGVPVKRSGQLINLIRRQPAGTWLPLQVMREGKAVEVVVRFPREAR
ncbi:ChaN family lipoprotein [Thauera sp.]|uniref:ChaN family lipoprotein n=1 Tax=Thauera sp. TaxID=1905334 RepID=UPI001B4A3102|nr:ChaN family lipoprotein [Thauera sp.]MBP6129977.1 ChaN family lipoprotein [Thauera sp.]MBP7049132.1 ChaN family lipoprotein [Thauera sp.]